MNDQSTQKEASMEVKNLERRGTVNGNQLRQSLVALATQDPDNTDVGEYTRRKTIVSPTALAENKKKVSVRPSDSSFRRKNTPSPLPDFGDPIGMLAGQQNSKRRQNEIELEFGDDSSSDDSVNRALKNVRQIPLDQYLEHDKVKQVKLEQEKRLAAQNAKLRNVQGKVRSVDKTFAAHGSHNQTGWSDLDKAEQDRRIAATDRKLMAMQYGDTYETRMHKHCARQRHGVPLKQRIKEKRQKYKRVIKRQAAGQSIGSEGAMSWWTQQDPRHELLVDRQIQYGNGIPRLGAASVDVQSLYENSKLKANKESQEVQFDDRSVQMSGMLVRRSKKLQTMTQYDLVPEVIYNSLEIKIRDLIKQILTPTHNRQQVQEKEQQKMVMQSHQFDARLRDCTMGIKKQLNMKAEFDIIYARMDAQNMQIRKLETDIANNQLDVLSKVERNAANGRVLASDVKQMTKFLNKKNDDTQRMQEIISSFKDRLMEKYAALSDEYTEQIKRLEHKQLGATDSISKMMRNMEGLIGDNVSVKVEQGLNKKVIENLTTEITGLKKCYKFEDRIHTLENQAKSDLIAVTRKLNEILYENKRNLKRSEALKLIYSMQTEMGQALVNTISHRCTEEATQEKPKLQPEIQFAINLLDWQINLNSQGPFNEKNLISTMNRYHQMAETDIKKMRKERLLLELSSKKIGRVVTRPNSKHGRLDKRDEFPPLELPATVKKTVKFNMDKINQIEPPQQEQEDEGSKRKSLLRNVIPKKQDLLKKKVDALLEPEKPQTVTCMSTLKRSRSWEWTTREKPTLDNLYTDPTALRMLERLKTSLASSNDLALSRVGSGEPTRQRRATLAVAPNKQKKKAKQKNEKRQKRRSDYQDVTSSNVTTTRWAVPVPSSSVSIAQVVANESGGPPTLQANIFVQDQHLSNEMTQGTAAASHPHHQMGDLNHKKKPNKKGKHESESSEDAFSSDSEDRPMQITEAMYDEFLSRAEFDEEIETAKADLQNVIIANIKGLIVDTSNQLIKTQVSEAQIQIGEMLQDQLHESQETMKSLISNEVDMIHRMTDRIEKDLIPTTILQINDKLEQNQKEMEEKMENALAAINQSIVQFTERLNYFATDISTTQKKFKRLVSDQDIFKARVEKVQKRTKEMVQVMRSEQLASSKIVSTLVELEFIQQSLDFQDEFDKTQMNLYGLNDLNMTLEEFIAKSGEIASRKLKHEALQRAAQLDVARGGDSPFDMTDSGTYQAIIMGEDWSKLIGNEYLSKQIHQAFKLACIYYKPSPVLYRGNSYNRRSLIEAKRQMLDADWHMIQKFQPFKRLWGEDSGIDFYEQFNTKLQALIQARNLNAELNKQSQEQAEDTFVKIMAGTNLYDLKLNDTSGDDELMSSDGEEIQRMTAAMNKNDPMPLNVSASYNVEATQASIKLLNESQRTAKNASKLVSSTRNRAFEMISNRNKTRKSPENAVASIESRTKSMLNAIQGKSIFGPSYEESIYSTAPEADKNNVSVTKTQSKRMYNRSVQRTEMKEKDSGNIFGEFLHSPFNANHSQVIENQYISGEAATTGSKNSQQQIKTTIIRKQSSSRNSRRQQYLTEKVSPIQHNKLHSSDNPLVEIRPLIGKDQLRNSQLINTQGTGAMDRDGAGNEYDDMRRSKQQSSLGFSPWNRTSQFGKMRQTEIKSVTSNVKVPALDMAVIGSKKDAESPKQIDGKQVRNLVESLKRSQLIRPTTLNFPLNLPIQTINISSPTNIDNVKPNSGGSQSMLSLPLVNQKSSFIPGQRYGEEHQSIALAGNLGVAKQQSFTALAKPNSRFNSSDRKKGGAQQMSGVVSNASLMWTPEDDMGNSMVAKLAHSPQSDPILDNSAVLNTTQKLKEIARQKKQQMFVREEHSSSHQY